MSVFFKFLTFVFLRQMPDHKKESFRGDNGCFSDPKTAHFWMVQIDPNRLLHQILNFFKITKNRPSRAITVVKVIQKWTIFG